MSIEFQVGDKGRTRGGVGYEIICVEKRVAIGESIVSLVDGQLMTSQINGCYWDDGTQSDRDLMPPARIVKVRFIDFGEGMLTLSEDDDDFTSEFAGTIYDETVDVEIP